MACLINWPLRDHTRPRTRSAFDEVLTEAERVRGRVWSLSGQLIKHAMSR